MSDKYDRKNAGSEKQKFEADHVISYFKMEWKVLLAVTVSGLIYNLGLLAGPWFEGKMAGCLVDILGGRAGFPDMGKLVAAYVIAIAVVQSSRYIKRFYVRRFANNVNRRMKHVLYDSLVHKSRAELEEEGAGNVMTKAILDVDDCAEGMRKFTTEIFDTGVALLAYAGMILFYDWRLALLSMLFPPVSYFLAEKMKGIVQRTGAAYKEQSGILSAATLDRASNAVTYRVYGCEQERKDAYEKNLSAYEKSAVRANIWSAAFPPIYRVISMAGVIFILYFGGTNVLGSGWRVWDVAAFTTFLTCFTKLSVKSSSAAKLFNAVHKAQVSWKRIKPLMKCVEHESESRVQKQAELTVSHLSFAYPGGTEDDESIARSVKTHLESWNYEVCCAEDFSNVAGTFAAFDPQLVLMDVKLPFFNGYHWCSEIRKVSKVPVIFVSSASDNMNIVMAVSMGGDDFIAKPFDLEVLTAKVQAMLRRTYDFTGQSTVLEHKGAMLNLTEAALFYEQEKIELTKNEFKILQVLMENKQKVVSRDTLMVKLWESDSFVDENTLSVNVNRLRKKLESVGLCDFIVTRKGIGYQIG